MVRWEGDNTWSLLENRELWEFQTHAHVMFDESVREDDLFLQHTNEQAGASFCGAAMRFNPTEDLTEVATMSKKDRA